MKYLNIDQTIIFDEEKREIRFEDGKNKNFIFPICILIYVVILISEGISIAKTIKKKNDENIKKMQEEHNLKMLKETLREEVKKEILDEINKNALKK